MAANSPVHVTVTGAAGQIGYSLLFRIASGQLLGPDQPVVLRLLEIEPGMKALEGVVMEIDDCAFPLVSDIVTTTDLNTAFDGTSWALLVGSIPRKAGMERGDLLTINGGIFGPQGRAIAAHAASDVRILVVGNPCNTNCLIARSNAPEVPSDRWFAMTRLDENRAKGQLAHKAGVPVASVTNVAIWGNHSATQFPDYANALIGGKPAAEVIDDIAWLQGDFLTTVQKRGAAIIDARGLSSAASAANAAVDSVVSIRSGTPGDDFTSLAVVSSGEYGVPEGLQFGFPGPDQRRRGLDGGGGAGPRRVRHRSDPDHHRGARGRAGRRDRPAALTGGALPRLAWVACAATSPPFEVSNPRATTKRSRPPPASTCERSVASSRRRQTPGTAFEQAVRQVAEATTELLSELPARRRPPADPAPAAPAGRALPADRGVEAGRRPGRARGTVGQRTFVAQPNCSNRRMSQADGSIMPRRAPWRAQDGMGMVDVVPVVAEGDHGQRPQIGAPVGRPVRTVGRRCGTAS